jgi:ABC-type oligopeptide transport system ATPase subunit
MARAYLSTSDINALHIHNGKTDKGTTFTIGESNPLLGKTTLGHLTNRDIDRLDGRIQIANTDSGKTQVIHRPHEPTMRKYANLSVDQPDLHRDVTDSNHAAEIKKLLDTHRKTLSENVSQLFN